jgi:general secretion pathway protein D
LLLLAAGCQSAGTVATATDPASRPSPEAVVEPVAQDGGTDQLSQDARNAELAKQRDAYLLDKHLTYAEELYANLRLEEARKEVEAALLIDPESPRGRDLRARILSLMGDPVARDSVSGTDMTAEYALRVQQLRAEVQEGVNKSRVLVARGDYQGAIAELEVANNAVRFAPYSIEWNGLDKEAADMLAQVRAQREAAEKAALDAARQMATEELRGREMAEVGQRTMIVNSILEQAIDAFERTDYEESERLAGEALRLDPRSQKARELKDAAFRAGRTQVRANYVEQKAEQFRRWRESMKELQVPYTDVITLPDPEKWNAMTALRARRPGLDLSAKIDPGEAVLRDLLRQTKLSLVMKDEESLTKVVDALRVQTDAPLVVDPAAEAAASEGGVVFTFSFENKITLEQALNLITKMAGENVTWTIRHEAVIVTTKEKARSRPIVVNHDVQDLVMGLTDFIGPRIDRIRLLDELQDDDGGGPFGGIGEKPRILEPNDLATLIQENVAVGTWQDEGVSIEAGEGFIVINHSPEVQEQVRQFLEDLRRFSSSLVTIESKFMTVAQNWIQEIGVDFRGLDTETVTDVTNGLEDQASRGLDNGGTGTEGTNAAGAPSAGAFYDDGQDGDFRATSQNFFGQNLGDQLSTIGGLTYQVTLLNDLALSTIIRAVEKTSDIQLINDQVLSVHNTQRAYVTVVNQRAYIQDFDVEVAQFQAVADPQINVLQEGIVLDVRPTIHHDRKYLTLEIQPTVARVVALRNFSSTLGGNTSPITFQLPELEVQSVFTTATIPDGGSLMLGGLSRVRSIERRAEVPWFAKVPIVGFFFKSEGYSDENRSLVILIRARITDVREELRRIETR